MVFFKCWHCFNFSLENSAFSSWFEIQCILTEMLLSDTHMDCSLLLDCAFVNWLIYIFFSPERFIMVMLRLNISVLWGLLMYFKGLWDKSFLFSWVHGMLCFQGRFLFGCFLTSPLEAALNQERKKIHHFFPLFFPCRCVH